MKRSIKNIIIILFIIITGICVYFTVEDVKENKPDSEIFKDMPEANHNMVEPPKRPDENQNSEEPPERPDGNQNSEEPPERPDGNQNSEEPPERPDGNQNFEELPERPDGNQNFEELPERPDVNKNSEQKYQIKIIHYIMFGMEALIILMMVIYLIISKFNKR